MQNRSGKTYVCIDLKSFYASVECAERGLDPDKALLVVADPARSEKTICLAISPAMKKLGVRNRCRVFEIPEGIKYFKAKPRMRLYMERSAQIYGIYLRHVSPADIYPYSIDECFIDATPYLALEKKTAREWAAELIEAVKAETNITATAGIGENLFLAKVALDVLAKKSPDFIGELTEASFRETMWHHEPITDVWNIGPGIAARLAKHGARTLYDVTQLPEDVLYREFGVNAEFLIDHAWGQEPCTIEEIKAWKPIGKSIANGQVLERDYSFEDARTVLREMVESSVLDMIEKGLAARRVSLHVGYAKAHGATATGGFTHLQTQAELKHAYDNARFNEVQSHRPHRNADDETRVFVGEHGTRIVGPGARNSGYHEATGGARTLDAPTNSFHLLFGAAAQLFDGHVDPERPIRRIMLGFSEIVEAEGCQMSLFSAPEEEQRERDIQKAMLAVQSRFGKNSVLFGTSLKKNATMRKRNMQIGGHNAG